MLRTTAASYRTIIDDNSESDSSASESTAVHGTDYNQPSPRREPSHDRERRRSFIEEDEESLPHLEVRPKKENKGVVTWSSLPHKRQLAILTIARFSEPLVQSSLRVSSSNLIGIARLTPASRISSISSNPLTKLSLTL
jgi:hypothetical protein